MSFLVEITRARANSSIGNKARGLKLLLRHNFPVPRAWVIGAKVKVRWMNDPDATDRQLLAELEQKIRPIQKVAVRSSGNLEDGSHHSYAGQFATLLDVQGAPDILKAIHQVWVSAENAQEVARNHDAGHANDSGGMAVIIQVMVETEWSGVAFSLNPVTGRNETVIEGVRGSGEQLVQDGITPERWIYHQGTWEDYERAAAPPEQMLDELVNGIQKLRRQFRGEVDVEWGWDGKRLWYLQCRSVTAQKFPTIYSNHISREVLPGMIKPLVWSVNIPVVNSAWIRLLEGMLGRLDLQPEDLSKSFYYRAYFNMGTLGELFRRMGLPRDSLESLMGRKDPSGKSSFKPGLRTLKYLPGMFLFLLTNLNPGKKFRKKNIRLNEATEALEKEIENASVQDYRELFERLHALSREAAYWNIIIPLTMQITNRLLQRKIEKKSGDFSTLEFTRDFPELLQHDPKYHLDKLAERWQDIPEALRISIKNYDDLLLEEVMPDLISFREDLLAMIQTFGHFSESGNDFSSEPWRENPGFLFEMIISRPPDHNAGTKKQARKNNTPGSKGRAYRRAGHYRLYREMISSSYTRTYGLFRNLFLVTGEYLASQGYIEQPADVFYLTLDEHDQLLGFAENGNPLNEDLHGSARESQAKGFPNDQKEFALNEQKIRAKVELVKKEIAHCSEIPVPSVIYGDTPPPFATPDDTILEGIPVSPGIFEGEIVVVNGYKDFDKEVHDRILVIPFSDVGWTPILSHAGAIVTESGGMLSHASIIARELGIPAISSVDHACRIKDGTKARVDGFNGMMILKS